MKTFNVFMKLMTVTMVTIISVSLFSCSEKEEEIIPPIDNKEEEKIDYSIELATSRQAVDLGLPSGTLWANMNVGASSNANPGGYYRWGETEEIFMVHSEEPYTCDYKYEYYDENKQTKCIDIGRDISGTQYDVAHMLWGQDWRMPTIEQFLELWEQCKHSEFTLSGQKGHVFVGKNGNKIFLPCGGSKGIGGSVWYVPTYKDNRTISLSDTDYLYYWTSSIHDNDGNGAWMISNYFGGKAYCGRTLANNVRPVYNKSDGSTSSFDTSLLIGSWKTTFEGNEYSVLTLKEDNTFTDKGFAGGESYEDSGTWSLNPNTQMLTLTYSNGSTNDGKIIRLTATELEIFGCVYLRVDGNNNNDDGIDEPQPQPNNHEWVDLGLPSGTQWATFNVGASKPEDFGDYFAWGETVGYNGGKTAFHNYNYKYYDGYSLFKYCTDSSIGTIDNKTELEPEDDAATVNWGSSWQMPSSEQFAELINSSYTTTSWTTLNDVHGWMIVSKNNGNNIFLPAAGHHHGVAFSGADSFGRYLSRSLHTSNTLSAFIIDFYSERIRIYHALRYYGQSVRPVRKKADSSN